MLLAAHRRRRRSPLQKALVVSQRRPVRPQLVMARRPRRKRWRICPQTFPLLPRLPRARAPSPKSLLPRSLAAMYSALLILSRWRAEFAFFFVLTSFVLIRAVLLPHHQTRNLPPHERSLLARPRTRGMRAASQRRSSAENAFWTTSLSTTMVQNTFLLNFPFWNSPSPSLFSLSPFLINVSSHLNYLIRVLIILDISPPIRSRRVE